VRVALFTAAFLLVVYGVGLVWVYANQRKLQYFPTHRDAAAKGEGLFLPWASKDHEFLGYVLPAGGMRALVLYFHGNAGEALDRAWFADVLPQDVGLILVEYPGYGAKAGEISQAAFFALAERAFDEAVSQSNVPIWVVGESLGSGVACYLATKRPVKKLGLISAFSSAADVGALAYPILPVRWLMKDPFPSLKYASVISTPTHLIHGSSDTMVPVEQARRLAAAFPHKNAVLTEIGNYGHSNMAEAILKSPRAEPFRAFFRN
jgi:uncharacterized protein